MSKFPELDDPWQRETLGMRVTHPAILAACKACHALAKAIGRNDAILPTLALVGHPGSGKTMLGKRMTRWARGASMRLYTDHGHRKPLSVTSCSWPEVCDGFKEGNYGIVSDLTESGFAFIDDIGAEHDPSQNAADKLCQILSRRENKWTIITTNIPADQWAARWDARIADRLMRRSTVIDMFDVPSFATL